VLTGHVAAWTWTPSQQLSHACIQFAPRSAGTDAQLHAPGVVERRRERAAACRGDINTVPARGRVRIRDRVGRGRVHRTIASAGVLADGTVYTVRRGHNGPTSRSPLICQACRNSWCRWGCPFFARQYLGGTNLIGNPTRSGVT
jgi:hypothetical protein